MICRTFFRALRIVPKSSVALARNFFPFQTSIRRFSSNKFTQTKMEHTQKKQFKAQTKKLLDIVAKSLYTDKQVFLRQLLSNASDALEKQRFKSQSSEGLKINVSINDTKKQLIIEDNGIGMSKQELIDNLGTIARSGSKEFVEALQKNNSSQTPENIIGQFGVGFYSSFIVSDYVQVISKTQDSDKAYIWSSDGSGVYEIGDTSQSDFERGTRVILHLKPDCQQFCKIEQAKHIIQKYSNFISYPITVNGEMFNLVKAIWARDKREVTEEEYQSFYQYLVGKKENYYTKLHYSADVPLSIKALLYIPNKHVENFGMSAQKGQVSLYSKKILIKKNCRQLLPPYFRFLKGVVDCEDIPLNISRQNYQDSILMGKLKTVITRRVIRHLKDQSQKNPEQYHKWYKEFEFFVKEGTLDIDNKKQMLELNRYECNLKEGWIGLKDYLTIKKDKQDKIFFMFSPNKEISKLSPFLEPYNKASIPVLITHTHIDEAVFRDQIQYGGLQFINIETTEQDLSKYLTEMKHDESKGIKSEDLTTFPIWIKSQLQPFVAKVVVSKKNISSPGLVISPISTSMRQMKAMMKIAENNLEGAPQEDLRDLTFEINPNHPLMAKLNNTRKLDSEIATLVIRQIFDNCCIEAGIVPNAKKTIDRLYDIMSVLMKNEINQKSLNHDGDAKKH